MIQWMRNKRKLDKADAMLVTGILSVPFLMLIFGVAIDITKNTHLDDTYHSMAQTSIEAGVKEIDSRGSLNKAAVTKFVNEYKVQSKPSESHTSETNVYESKLCSTAEINGVKRTLPYYEVTLQTARGNADSSKTSKWIIEGDKAVPNITINSALKYRVISADVYTSSENIMLGKFGIPCQVYKSSVSAIAFGSNSDL
jgi:hypothetical protein